MRQIETDTHRTLNSFPTETSRLIQQQMQDLLKKWIENAIKTLTESIKEFREKGKSYMLMTKRGLIPCTFRCRENCIRSAREADRIRRSCHYCDVPIKCNSRYDTNHYWSRQGRDRRDR